MIKWYRKRQLCARTNCLFYESGSLRLLDTGKEPAIATTGMERVDI